MRFSFLLLWRKPYIPMAAPAIAIACPMLIIILFTSCFLVLAYVGLLLCMASVLVVVDVLCLAYVNLEVLCQGHQLVVHACECAGSFSGGVPFACVSLDAGIHECDEVLLYPFFVHVLSPFPCLLLPFAHNMGLGTVMAA